MKRKLCLLLIMVMLAGMLCGCESAPQTHYADRLDDYVRTMEYRDGFTILQFTDIHWNPCTPMEHSKEYIKSLVTEAQTHAGKVDLIEITGDTFQFCTKRHVRNFIEMMSEIGVPYAIVWGNHDRSGNYSHNWLSEQFLNAPGCLYTEIDNDDVYGRSNYVVNLMDGSETAWQVINLDSGSSLQTQPAEFDLDYDYLRQNQLDWMYAVHDAAGKDVPSLCYYHIPQKESTISSDAAMSGDASYNGRFYMHEGWDSPGLAPDMTSAYIDCNVRCVLFGHDHSNNYVLTLHEGPVLAFGVKTGKELYYTRIEEGESDGVNTASRQFDLIGATLVTLQDRSGDFTIEHLYKQEEGGNAEWVKY